MKKFLFILLSVCFFGLTSCTKNDDDVQPAETGSIIAEDIIVN